MSRLVQITVSGIDGGGYVWENVFFLQTNDDTTDTPTTLQAAIDEVRDNLLPAYEAAASSDTKFLDVAAKLMTPITSYTMHGPVSASGSRAGTSQLGAVAGTIRLLASIGTKIGRIFVVGCLVSDFVLDVIAPAYQTLLEDIADVVFGWDGTVGPWNWAYQIVNKDALTGVNIAGYDIAYRPTTLNKRMRA